MLIIINSHDVLIVDIYDVKENKINNNLQKGPESLHFDPEKRLILTNRKTSWKFGQSDPNRKDMAEAYHNEALRKQRIVDTKHAAIARMKYWKVRQSSE